MSKPAERFKPEDYLAAMAPTEAVESSKSELVSYAPPRSVLELVERAARDPAIDVAKMRELLSLRKEAEDRVAEMAFNESLRKVQSEIPRISRDKKADKYYYATLEKITKAVNPIIAENGFSLSYGTADSPLAKHYRITCDLSHAGGHSRKYFVDIPADSEGDKGTKNKSDTKAFGSTMSYGRRYLIVMIFNIAITNEDDEGAGDDRIGQEEIKTITEMAKAAKADMPRFLKFLGVESIEELPTRRYDEAVTALQQKAKKKAAVA